MTAEWRWFPSHFHQDLSLFKRYCPLWVPGMRSFWGELFFHFFKLDTCNLQHFLSACRPAYNADGAFGQAKLFSEERDQCLIGSAAYRWGRQAHFQGPFFPLYTVLATSWQHSHRNP